LFSDRTSYKIVISQYNFHQPIYSDNRFEFIDLDSPSPESNYIILDCLDQNSPDNTVSKKPEIQNNSIFELISYRYLSATAPEFCDTINKDTQILLETVQFI